MLIPTNKEIYSSLKNQLALDFNCKPEDFDKTENVITLPALNEGRRVFSNEKFFLQIATLGDNAVISADEKLPFLFIKEAFITKSNNKNNNYRQNNHRYNKY